MFNLKVKDLHLPLVFVLIPLFSQMITSVLFKQIGLYINKTEYLWIIILLLFTGVFLMIRVIFWQLLLKTHPLSLIYPFTTFNYIGLLILGFFIFDEPVSKGNIIGTSLIIVGLVVIYRNK